MVDRIELNGMLLHAVQRKDFANRLLSPNSTTREKALGQFEKLNLTDQERESFMAFRGESLEELMRFCHDSFELDRPKVR